MSILDAISDFLSSAKSRARKKSRAKKKWMQKVSKRTKKGALHRTLGIPLGERIPYKLKDAGCKDPARTLKRVTGRKPTKAQARKFQKQACLARTYEERGGGGKKKDRAELMRMPKKGQLVPLPKGYGEWERLGTYVVANRGPAVGYPKRVFGPTTRVSAMSSKHMGDFVVKVVEIERGIPGGVNWGKVIWASKS